MLNYKKSNEKDSFVESNNKKNSESRKKNESNEEINKCSESLKILKLQKKIRLQVICEQNLEIKTKTFRQT